MSGKFSQPISFPGWLLPVLVGVASFYLLIGPLALNPTNLAWIIPSDKKLSYLGWAFFENSPWLSPIGLNPNAGMEISTSIIYSDSIPLLAFVFKLISTILPKPFQYLGIWLMICVVLQSIFAWLLVGLITKNKFERILGSTLFVFLPFLIIRFGIHIGLGSQFLILAGLYLNLRKTNQYRLLAWTLLLCTSILIQFYIFAIVFGLWCCNILDQLLIGRRISFKDSVLEICVNIPLLLIIFWQAGYLVINSSEASGGIFGMGRMNLLAPFDAQGFSYLLPNILSIDGDVTRTSSTSFEGFSYLGLGVIVLILFALYGLIFKSQTLIRTLVTKHFCLILFSFLCLLFSICNPIGIGPILLDIPMPMWVNQLGTIFRNNGRFFWLCEYLLIFASLLICKKSYSARASVLIFFCVLLVQVSDTSAGWLAQRSQLMNGPSTVFLDSLADSFWGRATKSYKNISRDPLEYWPNSWEKVALFAAQNGLPTNSFLMGRVNTSGYINGNERLRTMNLSGKFNPDSIYILEDLEASVASQAIDLNKDLLIRVDGLNVLAPDWFLKFPNDVEFNEKMLRYPKTYLGRDIIFGAGRQENLLLKGASKAEGSESGWGYPESWGVWSYGSKSQLIIPLPKDGAPKKLLIYSQFLVNRKIGHQEVLMTKETERGFFILHSNIEKIYIPLSEKTILKKDDGVLVEGRIEIPITDSDKKMGAISVNFEFPTAVSPRELGWGDDDRPLAMGLRKAKFLP